MPIFASLSDIHGRKPFFLLGATLFVATSALCGAAGKLTFLPLDGMGQLILFRGLQGVGAGMVMGLLFTIVGDIFSPAERGRYQGLFCRRVGRGVDLRTDAGRLAHRPLVVARVLLGESAGRRRGGRGDLFRVSAHEAARCDAAAATGPGSRRSSARVVPLLLALTWATQYGWTLDARRVAARARRRVMLGAFLYVESAAPEPVIPLVLFRDPIIASARSASFVLGIGMFGVIIYLPLFMQGVLGVSATQSGNLLTPLMMGAVVGSIVGGQAVSRTGTYKSVALIGSALVAIGMILVRASGHGHSRACMWSTAW